MLQSLLATFKIRFNTTAYQGALWERREKSEDGKDYNRYEHLRANMFKDITSKLSLRCNPEAKNVGQEEWNLELII